MITKEQILKAEGEELSRLLGEVLLNKRCVCNECEFVHEQCATDTLNRCGDACPIPLTWKEAMKWRDWAVENFSLFDVMESMRIIGQEFNKTHDRFYAWWTLEAQPKHYLKAAAICKLNSESE